MILEFFLLGVSRWLLWPIMSSARRCPSVLARASQSLVLFLEPVDALCGGL